MMQYHFLTSEFAISDTGIHLLRGGYNHATLDFPSLQSVEIKRGKEFRNWVILLVFSIALIGFALLYAFGLYQAIFVEQVVKIEAQELVVPVFTILLGGLCLYLSLRQATVLIVTKANGETLKFTLRGLEKAGQLATLKSFLRDQLKQKFQDSHA